MNFSQRTIYLGPVWWLFILGLLIKLALSWFFASDFLSELFIPFVSFFVETGFANPYSAFAGGNGPAAFPYPALMLYILTVPKALLGWISDAQGFNQLIFRLPLIAADLWIFFILKSWLKPRHLKRLVAYYWCSPVLIYISYVHGQLDAIPIALLFASLFHLFKDRIIIAALFLGLALAAKTNVAIVFPFFLIYLIRKNTEISVLLSFVAMFAASFFAVNINYIGQSGFAQMVFNNQEQSKLFNVAIEIDSLSVYLVPLSLLVLFFRGALIRIYNRDIFLMFLGFTFCVLLLFIPPMPGWYFWLLPFLCYFYIKQDAFYALLLYALQGFYFLYFFLRQSVDIPTLPTNEGTTQSYQFSWVDFAIVDGSTILNLAFTLLQVALLINCAWIYRRGLESYSRHKITASPFLIGIGGNSGVGKSTLTDGLSSIFGSRNTTVVRGDDMHKWQRGHTKWKEHTHLDPKANHLHREAYFLKRLKSGRKIHRRHYDHDIGQFTDEKPIYAKSIVIFEGLHPFFLASQRALYDLKIFIKPSEELGRHWKIIRDQAKRGYSKEKVIEAIEARKGDAAKYIDTQSEKADFLVEVYPQNPIKQLGDKDEQVDVYYKLSFSNEIFAEPLVIALSEEKSLQILHEYKSDDTQALTICGTGSSEFLQALASEFISELEDLGISNRNLPDGMFGILLIVLIYVMFDKEMYDRQ